MAYLKFNGTFRSSNHINRIHYYILEPETDLRAILQISHGCKEYIERNEELIRYFTDHGIMVCGCDHIGHGKSSDREAYGYFAEKNGWSYLVKDIKKLTHYMKKEYPLIPLFLYGQGMGSLVARLCALHEEEYAGIILSGTSGKRAHCKRSILVLALLRRILGSDYKSEFLKKYYRRKLNKKFSAEEEMDSWFCEDQEARMRYARDEKCNFSLSLSAYEDIFKMLALVSSRKWYQSANKDLPFLLVSGEEDVIGGFGKGVRDVYEKLLATDHDAHIKLYQGMRHSLSDEKERDAVFFDILDWMKNYMEE